MKLWFMHPGDDNWYEIRQVSFWRRDYAKIDFVEKQLNINDLNIKKSLYDNNLANYKN